MIYSRDYILRMLQQLHRALVTIMKLRQEEQYEEALDTVGDTVDELLGHQAHFLHTMTTESVVRILDKWPKLKIYSALLAAEADVLEARRAPEDLTRAPRLRCRALEILLLGRDRGGRGDPELLDRARELAERVPLTDLSPSLQSLAQDLGLRGP